MSPRLRIYYNAVVGGLGGLFGWLLISLYVPALPGLIVLSDAAWGSVVGVMIGGLLGIIDGLFLRSLFRLARGLAYGAGAGFLAGLIGLPVGEGALLLLGGGVQARAIGWSLFGFAIGMSEGLANRMPRKTSYGAVGGALGGALGGLIFESLVRVTALQSFSRALGLVILGACIGSLMGSVEEVLKRAWIMVVSGRSEGREYPLLKATMTIGRDERCAIPLFGDTTIQPRHAEIRHSGRDHIMVPLASPVSVNQLLISGARVLSDGDRIRVGNTDLMYRLRRAAFGVSTSLLLLCMLALAVGPVHAAVSARVTQIDKSQFPTVRVYVSVLDPGGTPVQGLQAGDFQVFEDNRPAPILEFLGGKGGPITVVLVLDRSGSMAEQGKLHSAREAAKTFLRLLRPGDQVAVVVFSERPDVLSSLTSDTATLSALLDQVGSGGGTAHYDGVVEALRLLRSAVGRRAVISLTDGMDNSSRNRLETVLTMAIDDSVPVYTIGLGFKGVFGGLAAGIDERPLQRLAAESGGQYFYAPDASALKGLYRAILEQIEREYRLAYQSPRPDRDGTRRNVRVRVRSAGTEVDTGGTYLVAGVIGTVRPARLWPIFFALLVPLLALLVAPTALRHRRGAPRRKGERPASGLVAWRLVPRGQGNAIRLRTDRPVLVGRGLECDFVIPHSSVAPIHVEIRWDSRRFVLQTMGREQAFVRLKGASDQERAVTRCVLERGTVVRIGAFEFNVEA